VLRTIGAGVFVRVPDPAVEELVSSLAGARSLTDVRFMRQVVV
jgi:hypothetical protein